MPLPWPRTLPGALPHVAGRAPDLADRTLFNTLDGRQGEPEPGHAQSPATPQRNRLAAHDPRQPQALPADYGTIIPEMRIGFGRKEQSLRDIVLCIDQSGSIAPSVVYASEFAAVLPVSRRSALRWWCSTRQWST
jgi:hypothetical protein